MLYLFNNDMFHKFTKFTHLDWYILSDLRDLNIILTCKVVSPFFNVVS